MKSFEIDISDIELFKVTLEKMLDGSIKLNINFELIQGFQVIHQKIIEECIFEEQHYLELLQQIASKINDENEQDYLNLLVIGSCITANVRSVFSEAQLFSKIGKFLDLHPHITTDYNSVLLKDILTNYYYNELLGIQSISADQILKFLIQKLEIENFGINGAITILHWLRDDRLIQEKDFRKLMEKIASMS